MDGDRKGLRRVVHQSLHKNNSYDRILRFLWLSGTNLLRDQLLPRRTEAGAASSA